MPGSAAIQGIGVSGGGGGAGVLFHADWSSLTGTSTNAVTDYLKTQPWDTLQLSGDDGGASVFNVISSSGLGFPSGMTNVLRVTRKTFDNVGYLGIGQTGGFKWAALGIGDTFFGRFYLKVDHPNDQPDNGALSNHSFAQPFAGNYSYLGNFYGQNDGTMTWQIHVNPDNSFPRDHAMLGPTYYGTGTKTGETLPKFTVLRIEWMWRRDTSTGYSFYYRVYDATNEASGGAATLMWSEDGVGASLGAVYEESASSPKTLKQNDGLYTVTLDNLRSFRFGPNGGKHDFSPDVYWYGGGVCFRSDTWCGAYSGGI